MSDHTDKNILAIDTSTRKLKLAVRFGGDRLVKSDVTVEKSHGRVIMRQIANLLESADMDRRQLEALVVSTGPGSFTGLRIGLAVAKGMAFGLDIPVLGVSLFELAAFKFRDETQPVRVLVPFKRGEFFLGTLVDGICDLEAVEVVSETQLPELLDKGRLIAAGFDLSSMPHDADHGAKLQPVEFDAAELLYAGDRKLARGETIDLAQLEPLYLRKSQAEIRFERRHGTRHIDGGDPADDSR